MECGRAVVVMLVEKMEKDGKGKMGSLKLHFGEIVFGVVGGG